jgi:hypothetical protein
MLKCKAAHDPKTFTARWWWGYDLS